MISITEDYVSFETAKLLKEKEFDIPCWNYYDTVGNFTNDYLSNHNFQTSDTSAPTLQMAMKWLRKVHNVHVIVNPYTDKEGQHWSFIFDKYAYGCWQELGIYITDSWDSYEGACEAAIKYCLENLI